MGGQNITHAYVPKKGNQKGAQRQSTIKYTLNEDLARESHAHDEYIQSFKHTKDIRDQMNSEQNIITWKIFDNFIKLSGIYSDDTLFFNVSRIKSLKTGFKICS